MNMMVSAAAIASTATVVSASPKPSTDAALLEMEEKIFQHKFAAEAFNPEIDRLQEILREEYRRLYNAAMAAGNAAETTDRHLEHVSAMPEGIEQSRLV
jgi:hypothetical protein